MKVAGDPFRRQLFIWFIERAQCLQTFCILLFLTFGNEFFVIILNPGHCFYFTFQLFVSFAHILGFKLVFGIKVIHS